MLRFLCRACGAVLLAGGLAMLLIDGSGSLSASRLIVTSLQQSVAWVQPTGALAVPGDLARYVPALVWQPLLGLMLQVPTFILLVLGGGLLMLAGQPRTPAIGRVPR